MIATRCPLKCAYCPLQCPHIWHRSFILSRESLISVIPRHLYSPSHQPSHYHNCCVCRTLISSHTLTLALCPIPADFRLKVNSPAGGAGASCTLCPASWFLWEAISFIVEQQNYYPAVVFSGNNPASSKGCSWSFSVSFLVGLAYKVCA